MRLLEYESKEILAKRGIPTPAGIVISSPGPISLPPPLVIKAQIPVGGRQKAGGVVEALDQEEAEHKVEQMLFSTVRDYRVNKVLVEEKLDIVQELYLGITYDKVTIVEVTRGTAAGKIEQFQKAGIHVADGLNDIVSILETFL